METLYSDFISVHQASIHNGIKCVFSIYLYIYALFFSYSPNIITTFSEVIAINQFLLYNLSPFYVIQTFCHTLQMCCLENGSLTSTVKNGNQCWMKEYVTIERINAGMNKNPKSLLFDRNKLIINVFTGYFLRLTGQFAKQMSWSLDYRNTLFRGHWMLNYLKKMEQLKLEKIPLALW